MSIGEYFTIFTAMLVGLAVADIALSLHRLIRAGKTIRWDWLSPVLALIMLCYVLNLWWGFYFSYSNLENINFGWFLLDVATLLILFLMSAAVLPDEKLAEGASLREFYWNSCTHFWSLHALYMAFVIAKNVQILQDTGADRSDYFTINLPMAMTAIGSLVLIRLRWVWLHALMIVTMIYTIVRYWIFYTLA